MDNMENNALGGSTAVRDENYEWYILHTNSGYENVAEENLRNMVENNKLQNYIVDIKVPIKYTEDNRDTTGMGTTVVLALLTKDFLIFGNIGDSSGYVLKNQKLHKVTKDHTLVNVLVESGELTEEEAMNHPKKNVLMKALGACERVDLDIFDVDTSVDGIFLCSDGLTNMLSNEQIERVLNDTDLSIEEKLEKLIKKANIRGGNDNISIAYLIKESGESL